MAARIGTRRGPTGQLDWRRTVYPGRHSAPSRRKALTRSKAPRGWFIATLTSVGGIAGVSLWIGPAPVVAPWDVFTLLNGAYRIYEGQAPSTDFTNPVGPLVYGLTAVGMHLQREPSLRAVTFGQVLFVALAATLAWLVASRRLPGFYAAAFTVFVALLSVSVRPLGYSPWTTTYAMLYNRDGWVLYSSLLLLVLLRRTGSATKGGQIADGLLLGLIAGLLFYDKITFFLAGLAAVGLGFALATFARSPRLLAAAAAGFTAVAVTMWAAFGLNPGAYIADLVGAAKVQVAGQRAHMLADTIVWTLPVALVTVIVVGILLAAARRQGDAARRTVMVSLAIAYVLGSSIILSAGDATEKGDLPALVVVPLLLVAFLGPALPRWAGGPATPDPGGGPQLQVPRFGLVLTALVALLVGTTGPIVGKDLLALGKDVSLRTYDARPPVSQRFRASGLSDFVIPADAQWETAYRVAHDVPAMINNGLSLLRGHIRPGDTVFTLAYTDPFAVALHLPLSRCGLLWWDVGYDFDQRYHPDAACAIGSADWVMIPRMVPGQGCCQQTVAVMRSLYAGYLSAHYAKIQQTPDWILLRRKR